MFLARSSKQTARFVPTNNNPLDKFVQNTLHSLSSQFIGQELTDTLAPVVRDVLPSISTHLNDQMPNIKLNSGRIVVEFPDRKDEEKDPKYCSTPSGEDGKCQDLSHCPQLLLNLENLRKSICFQSIFVPGLCCPR